jgi:hypothetical protein
LKLKPLAMVRHKRVQEKGDSKKSLKQKIKDLKN